MLYKLVNACNGLLFIYVLVIYNHLLQATTKLYKVACMCWLVGASVTIIIPRLVYMVILRVLVLVGLVVLVNDNKVGVGVLVLRNERTPSHALP